MMANAISHTVLFGIALLFIGMKIFSKTEHFAPLSLNMGLYIVVSVITTFLTIFLIECLKKYTHINNDASTAIVFSTLFSAGAILITLFTRSSHVGVDIIMGNLDLVHVNDLITSVFILIACVSFIFIFMKDLTVFSFDRSLAHFSKRSMGLLEFGFLFLTSLTITSGFRFIGIAPVLGLIILPPVCASLYSKSISEMITFSIYSNIAVGLIAVMTTKFFYQKLGIGLSTSGMLVTLHFVLFLSLLVKKRGEART
jgi:manganese/zinc/iron transport system permease protein